MKTTTPRKPCDFAQYLRDITPLFDKAAKREHEAYLRNLRNALKPGSFEKYLGQTERKPGKSFSE